MSQLLHGFLPGAQPQGLLFSWSFSYSESGLGEKYADEDDGCEVCESDRGGLGRSPNDSKLAFTRFWSERHVRNPWLPDVCLGAFCSLAKDGVLSRDGEVGSIS